ncbi:MAG: metal-sulfur cluster assembly factor [Candidatus Micrarchaeota archaeon]
MVTKGGILKKLGTVMDPELGMSIVDMGLIYEVDVRKKKKGGMQKVFIRMTFTTPACPLMNEILNDVKSKLDGFKDADIEVSIVFDPPWTPERLSDKAKIRLGMI